MKPWAASRSIKPIPSHYLQGLGSGGRLLTIKATWIPRSHSADESDGPAVIRQLNLDKRPDLAVMRCPKHPIWSPIRCRPIPIAPHLLLSAFAEISTSLWIPNTGIIEIHYNSTDPQLAAGAVNTACSTYVEQNFKTKFESTMQASDWLSKQLSTCR